MKRFIIKTFDLENKLSKITPENRFFLALGIGTLLGLIIPLTVIILFNYLTHWVTFIKSSVAL